MTSLQNLRDWLASCPEASLAPAPATRWPIGLECLLPESSYPKGQVSEVTAVQSIWSRPYHSPSCPSLEQSPLFWKSRLAALCCWSYSAVQLARFHRKVEFFGDSESVRLAERLELPYTSFKDSLNGLEAHDPRMWSTGKLLAFKHAPAPFIHVDWDVILFQPLPGRVQQAAYSCQCADPLWQKDNRLSVAYARTALEVLEHQSLPVLPGLLDLSQSHNFGIFGCQDSGELREWCSNILLGLWSNAQTDSFSRLPHSSYSILFWEQWLISYMVKEAGKGFECLFADDARRFEAASLGYTHFISTAKHNPVAVQFLLDRFAARHPARYEHCLRLDRDLPVNS